MNKDIVSLKPRRFWKVDPRIKFILAFISSILIAVIESEIAFLMALVIGLMWCVYCGKWKNALQIGGIYILIQYWAYWMLQQETVSGMIVTTTMIRRFLLLGAFITPLASVKIGSLVAAMYKLRLPRFIIISMAIMFRFLPTIREEYRAVRTSQKFRGIGRSIISVLIHPIIFYETLLVPLAIRIMKISDELSAAAMLRGADRKGNGTCFRDVKIVFTDVVAILIVLIAMTVTMLVNYGVILEGIAL